MERYTLAQAQDIGLDAGITGGNYGLEENYFHDQPMVLLPQLQSTVPDWLDSTEPMQLPLSWGHLTGIVQPLVCTAQTSTALLEPLLCSGLNGQTSITPWSCFTETGSWRC